MLAQSWQMTFHSLHAVMLQMWAQHHAGRVGLLYYTDTHTHLDYIIFYFYCYNYDQLNCMIIMQLIGAIMWNANGHILNACIVTCTV